MKRVIALCMCLIIVLTGCTSNATPDSVVDNGILENELTVNYSNSDDKSKDDEPENVDSSGQEIIDFQGEEALPDFSGLDDPNLYQYVESDLYANLESLLNSEDYIIEDIQVKNVSKEYLEEQAYNSLPNVYFGYTLKDLSEYFDENRYIFTLSDGDTTVRPFEEYEDSYEELIKDVAIGAGIILVSVILSAATAGAATPVMHGVHVLFATTATTAKGVALSAAAIGGIQAGIITGIETGDFKETLKASAKSAAESFKWGAIIGTAVGTFKGVGNLVKTTSGVSKIGTSAQSVKGTQKISPQESEAKALKIFKGEAQKSYLNGKEVPYGTPKSTRPDIVVKGENGRLKAIEVKNYNIESSNGRQALISTLKNQMPGRVQNMPPNTEEIIAIETQGYNISEAIKQELITDIQKACEPFYNSITVEFML